jgi:hypothetical protein
LNDQEHIYQVSYNLSMATRDGSEAHASWLIDLLREKLVKGTAEDVVAAARVLAKLKVKNSWARVSLQQRLHKKHGAQKPQRSSTDIEEQRLDEETVALAAAHSLFLLDISDETVPNALHTHLLKAHDMIVFWLVVDFCLRHKIREQWLIDALHNKLLNGRARQSENKEQRYIVQDQEESAMAAAALVHLRVKDKELVDWLLRKLDTPEMASKAAEDLGELGGVDDNRVLVALRQRINLEMDQGNEGDIALLSAAANSMVKLGAQDQVVLIALLRSIEKGDSKIRESIIRESAKTLYDLNHFDQQLITLLRKRLEENDPFISRVIAKVLSDFDVRDEVTLEKLREKLDFSDNTTEEAAAYAKLALIDPAQQFEEKLERLWQELLSPEAESSSGYRRAVQNAFELLAKQQLEDEAGGAKDVEVIRARLIKLRSSAEIHRQLAAYNILENIDEAIKKRQQETSN